MQQSPSVVLTAMAAIMSLAGPVVAAEARDVDIGRHEFDNRCAVCHGSGGTGDGPMAGMLTSPPADLTRLAAANGGVFPFQRVYEVIDGRQQVKGHGERDMPIWGRDYQQDRVGAATQFFGMPYDMELFVRVRILALIDHIYQLQER